MILPAEENMRSGAAAEVAGTAKTFLPKRTIHGTTEEARLNTVRGFLCNGNSCKRILHKASAMSELDLLRGREDAEDAAASQSPDSPSSVMWVRMDSSAARVSSMSTTNMSLTCFQAAFTSLGGMPGRLGTFRAPRRVDTIWICEKWHIQRERKRPHKDVSDSAISECIILVKSVTDRTEQEKRGKDCTHTSQREKASEKYTC